MALSVKHLAFIDQYMVCGFNATEAYSRVYPNATRETARRNGHELLTNTDIAEEIKRRIAERTMAADEVLIRLAEQARNEHSQYITASGGVNLAQMIADGKAHLVKGIKRTQFGDNIEFHDAQAALVHIGKHHGLFTDKVEHSGEVTVTQKGYATAATPEHWDDEQAES